MEGEAGGTFLGTDSLNRTECNDSLNKPGRRWLDFPNPLVCRHCHEQIKCRNLTIGLPRKSREPSLCQALCSSLFPT
eukprot:33632-Karenia_brevis.AAC.1